MADQLHVTRWRCSGLLQVFEWQGDPSDCSFYTAVKSMDHAIKVTEHVREQNQES